MAKETDYWAPRVMETLAAHRPDIELPFGLGEVISAVESVTATYMFRTPLGMHYEAEVARDGMDAEVDRFVKTDMTVVVLGRFPDMGEVTLISAEPPQTTIRTSRKVRTPIG